MTDQIKFKPSKDCLTRRVGHILAESKRARDCILPKYQHYVVVDAEEIVGCTPYPRLSTWRLGIFRKYLGECTDTPDGVLFRKIEP